MSNEESNLPKTSEPATAAMKLAGITQLEHLQDWREADLLKLRGVGPKAVRILKEHLAAKGL